MKVYNINLKDGKARILIPESVVISNCIKWLWHHGVFCWRNNTGAYKPESGGYVRYGYPGSSDIIGIYNGRAIFVECKRSHGGKQEDSQKVFKEKVEAAGALYIIARSIDDLESMRDKILA